MIFSNKSKIAGSTSLVFLLSASSIVGMLLMVQGISPSFASSGPSTLPSTKFVAAQPAGSKGPDDITGLSIAGLNGGKLIIWTAYQNGIQANGTAGELGGPTTSTIAGYDQSSGSLVKTINVTGKVDGLTADPKLHRLIATVNEDSNSALDLM